MTSEEKKQLKTMMERKLAELESSMANLEELVKPIAPDRAYGRVGRADAMVTQGVHASNLNNMRYSYAQLKKSLERIDQDDFGKCSWCGGDIGFHRLEAMPEASKCVRCA